MEAVVGSDVVVSLLWFLDLGFVVVVLAEFCWW